MTRLDDADRRTLAIIGVGAAVAVAGLLLLAVVLGVSVRLFLALSGLG